MDVDVAEASTVEISCLGAAFDGERALAEELEEEALSAGGEMTRTRLPVLDMETSFA